MERNPLLERDEGGPDIWQPENRSEERRDADTLLVDRPDNTPSEAPLDMEVDNSFDEGSPNEGPSYDPDAAQGSWERAGTGGRNDFSDDDRGLEQTLAEQITLRDHLLAQLSLDFSDNREKLIGHLLIDSLDDSGYLRFDIAESPKVLGIAADEVERVLVRLQKFDPPGLFARSLKECLALQLKDRNRYDPAMEALLDHLDLLAKRDFNGLLTICGVDAEDLHQMIGEIRALDPKPALRFDGAPSVPVIPDVLMRTGPDGDWVVELNPDTLPRVLVNQRYYARISKSAVLSKEDKTFLTERLQTASWLAKSLDQRAQTILKVATELVIQQRTFFERGVPGLKPLILRDIATAIEMHESTVSRVTSNKYIATPRGIYELKYFFTQSIAGADGAEAHSAEAVRHRIRALIDAESADAVLSDDTIVDVLRRDGIDIARRTVAKYRESMKISSSVQRRREKNADRGFAAAR